MAQLLNNIIVWMVLYCEHQLFGVKKKTKPFLHLSLGKAGPFTLESHVFVGHRPPRDPGDPLQIRSFTSIQTHTRPATAGRKMRMKMK